jgi:hypothetical protein
MNSLQDFQKLIGTQNITTSFVDFFINLMLVAILSGLLSQVYKHFGRSHSNRDLFSKNFVILGTTTMIVISIVKSSLALSLGLVGALSIVRFRTAIKEPEELVYLFFCIALGLGLGADQRLITCSSFVIVTTFLIVRSVFDKHEKNFNMHLIINTTSEQKNNLEDIVNILQPFCTSILLKRYDYSTENISEISLLIEFENFKKMHQAQLELQDMKTLQKFIFIDNQGVI